jgi:hypothetical protein
LDIQSITTDAVITGNELTSSFNTTTIEITPASTSASCSLLVNSVPQNCLVAVPVPLSLTGVSLTISLFVGSDIPRLYQNYAYTALQQPCVLDKFDVSSSSVSQCVASTDSVDINCLVVSGNPQNALSFPYVVEQYCQFSTIQILNGSDWVNVTNQDTFIEYGINQYRLVYSSISNPPLIEELASASISLGLSDPHQSCDAHC